MWHPLRLAEDYATVDWLTNGRVVFGVGRGYHTREVEAFGAPMLDQDANRELFEEQVELIFKSFNERAFAHQGKHYTIPPPVPYRGYELREITLVPRPKTLPVECWQPVVSASPRALDFMAKHDIRGIIGGGAAPGGAQREGRPRLPRGARPGRARGRAGRGPLHRLLVPHRRQRRAGHQGGDAVLRGEHQDVRARSASCPASPRSRSRRWPTRSAARQANLPTLRQRDQGAARG